jgi:hypothetical protein
MNILIIYKNDLLFRFYESANVICLSVDKTGTEIYYRECRDKLPASAASVARKSSSANSLTVLEVHLLDGENETSFFL